MATRLVSFLCVSLSQYLSLHCFVASLLFWLSISNRAALLQQVCGRQCVNPSPPHTHTCCVMFCFIFLFHNHLSLLMLNCVCVCCERGALTRQSPIRFLHVSTRFPPNFEHKQNDDLKFRNTLRIYLPKSYSCISRNLNKTTRHAQQEFHNRQQSHANTQADENTNIG